MMNFIQKVREREIDRNSRKYSISVDIASTSRTFV